MNMTSLTKTCSIKLRHVKEVGNCENSSVSLQNSLLWNSFSFKRSDVSGKISGLWYLRRFRDANDADETLSVQSALWRDRKLSASWPKITSRVRTAMPFLILAHFTKLCPSFNPMLGLLKSGLPDASSKALQRAFVASTTSSKCCPLNQSVNVNFSSRFSLIFATSRPSCLIRWHMSFERFFPNFSCRDVPNRSITSSFWQIFAILSLCFEYMSSHFCLSVCLSVCPSVGLCSVSMWLNLLPFSLHCLVAHYPIRCASLVISACK